MKKILSILLLLIASVLVAQPTYTQLKTLQPSVANGSVMITGPGTGTLVGVPQYTPTLPTSIITGTALTKNTTSITINGVTKTFTSTPTFSVTSTDGLQDVIDNNPSVNGLLAQSYPFGYSTIMMDDNAGMRFDYNTLNYIDIGNSDVTIQSFGDVNINGTSGSSNITLNAVSVKKNGNEIATTDQLPVITGSTNVTVSGTTPNYTISSPSQSLSISGNTISLSANGGSVTIPSTSTVGLQAQLNGTGLVRQTGTVTTYDNSTYLTGNQSITLSGDVTGTGSTAITASLATVNSNVGSFGQAANTLTASVNAKGLVTAIREIPIQITESQVTNLPTDLNTKANVISGIIATGTNSYTATYTPTFVLTTGLNFVVTFTNVNTTTVTLNVNSTGTVQVVKGNSTPLVAGDIPVGPLLLVYNGTNYVIVGSQLVNQSTSWSPTYTGFGVIPTGIHQYFLQDKLCTVTVQPGNGTSNATTFTMTFPFAAKYTATYSAGCSTDGGTLKGLTFVTTSGSNVVTMYAGAAALTAWSASGNKRALFVIQYEIQ